MNVQILINYHIPPEDEYFYRIYLGGRLTRRTVVVNFVSFPNPKCEMTPKFNIPACPCALNSPSIQVH